MTVKNCGNSIWCVFFIFFIVNVVKKNNLNVLVLKKKLVGNNNDPPPVLSLAVDICLSYKANLASYSPELSE